MIDALGTLSISDHGISRFFGPTGGCEVSCLCNLLFDIVSKELNGESEFSSSAFTMLFFLLSIRLFSFVQS